MRWLLTVQLVRLRLFFLIVLFTAVMMARLLWSIGRTSQRSKCDEATLPMD